MRNRAKVFSAAIVSFINMGTAIEHVAAQSVSYTFSTYSQAAFSVTATVLERPDHDEGNYTSSSASATDSQVIGQQLSVPGFSESVVAGNDSGTYFDTLTATGEENDGYAYGGIQGELFDFDNEGEHNDYASGTFSPSGHTVGANVFADVSTSVGIFYDGEIDNEKATVFGEGNISVTTTISVTDFFNPNPSGASPPPTSVSYGALPNWAQGGTSGYTPPNGTDAVAVLTSTSSPVTVNLPSGGLTLGTLGIDSGSAYTLAGSGTLTLQTSSGPAQVVVSQGSHTISAPLAFASDTTFLLAPSSTLNLSQSSYSIDGKNVAVNGGGVLGTSGSITLTDGGTLTLNSSSLSASIIILNDSSVMNVFGNSDGSGASLSTTLEFTGYGSLATSTAVINQSGGTNTSGNLDLSAGATGSGTTYNLLAGDVTAAHGITLGFAGGTASAFNQTSGTVAVPSLFLSRAAGSTSTYSLSGGSLATTTEYIGYANSSSISAVFSQNGGANAVSGNMIVGNGSNAGAVAEYAISGGTLSVGGSLTIAPEGTFEYDGGSVTANVDNSGTFNVRGGGTETLTGDFTNETGATLKTYGTTFDVTGTFTNNGTYNSDPALNHFAILTVGRIGALLGAVGDKYFVTDSLTSDSSNSKGWNTEQASLTFDGSGSHIFDVNGVDAGPTWSGYKNNFAWGFLTVGHDQSLSLINSSSAAQGGLYIGTLDLADGITQLANISSNGVNVYYDAALNPWLTDASYSLTGGGELLPVTGDGGKIALSLAQAVPEPCALSLFGFGLASVLRRSAITCDRARFVDVFVGPAGSAGPAKKQD